MEDLVDVVADLETKKEELDEIKLFSDSQSLELTKIKKELHKVERDSKYALEKLEYDSKFLESKWSPTVLLGIQNKSTVIFGIRCHIYDSGHEKNIKL